jgi:hypothetical protein
MINIDNNRYSNSSNDDQSHWGWFVVIDEDINENETKSRSRSIQEKKTNMYLKETDYYDYNLDICETQKQEQKYYITSFVIYIMSLFA